MLIIDTGASNYVTYDSLILTNKRKVKHSPVGLLDGKFVNANQVGIVTLPRGLQLENVLYVPPLTCNLISVI